MEKICLNVGKGEDVRKNWWIKKISWKILDEKL